MQIHQLVPALHDGDAIGDSARAMRDFLRSQGFESRIYAYTIDESLAGEAIDFSISAPDTHPHDVLIYHFALPSGMTDFIKRANCRKTLIYHNITPAYYWLPYDPSLVHLATAGRAELESLAAYIDRSAGDSEFNRLELEKLKYSNTCVLPIYVKEDRYKIEPSKHVMNFMNDGSFNMLFVGRVAPNKKLEDVMRVFLYYRKYYSQPSRLVFAGKTNVVPAYFASLKELSARLSIGGDDLVFTGHIDWPELVAYYKASHVFLSMSEHEGFCVPLVEAMICGTPIVAYAAAAVPYTLGNSGVQFQTKDYEAIAAVCHRLGVDHDFREAVLQSQRQELKRFSREQVEKSIMEFLQPLF
jgi:glycosyltransferase involved in cell wall biosynthesis